MPKLFVIIEGGTVSCVCSHQPARFNGIDVAVVDYNTDGATENELTGVRQKDGSVEPARVHIQGVVAADISIENDLHEAIDPTSPMPGNGAAATHRRENATRVLPIAKKYDWIEKPRRVKNLRAVNTARRERCELCASKNGGMHIHHVKSRGAGGNDVPENLVCLCWRCHDEVHRGVISRNVFQAFIRRRNEFRGRLRAS
jgi:5-methylcytosine-specific restriction endonuclease McrA